MKLPSPLRYYAIAVVVLVFAIGLYFILIGQNNSPECYLEYERYRTTGLNADSAKVRLAHAKTPEDSLFYLGVYVIEQSRFRTEICLPEIKQILRLTKNKPCELCTAQALYYLSSFSADEGGAGVAKKKFDSLASVSKDAVIQAYHYYFLGTLAIQRYQRVTAMQWLLKSMHLLEKEAPHARLMKAVIQIRLNRIFAEIGAHELLKENMLSQPDKSWPESIFHGIQAQRFQYFMLKGKYDSARRLLDGFPITPYAAEQWSLYYYKLNYMDSLKIYLKKEVVRYDRTRHSIVRPLSELGILYFNEGELDSAKLVAKELMAEADEKREEIAKASAFTILVKALLKQQQYDSALAAINQFERFGKKNEFLEEVVAAYRLRSDYYEKINRPDLALQAIKTSYDYQKKNDSVAGSSGVQRLFFNEYARKQKEIISLLSNQKNLIALC
jgi:hypothetical protein